jgi:hypothetical protein
MVQSSTFSTSVVDGRKKNCSFSQMTIRLVLQWLASLLSKGWTTTSINSARLHEKDNGVYFSSLYNFLC